jgi:hypothetical protein
MMKQNENKSDEIFSPPKTNSGSLDATRETTREMASSSDAATADDDAAVNSMEQGVLLETEEEQHGAAMLVVTQQSPGTDPGGHQDTTSRNSTQIAGLLVGAPRATNTGSITPSGIDASNSKSNAESLLVRPSSSGLLSSDGDVALATNMSHEEQESKKSSDHNSDEEEEEQSSSTAGRKLYRDVELLSGVTKMARSTCDSHRDLLFGLFLRSTTASELESLSRESGARLAEVVKDEKNGSENKNKKRAWWEEVDYVTRNSVNSSIQGDKDSLERSSKKKRVPSSSAGDTKTGWPLPSPIALVSLALEPAPSRQDYSRQRMKKVLVIPPINHDAGREGGAMKRPDHASLKLRELEAKVLLKFESCLLGKKAIATDNPQYEWYLTKSGEIGTKPSVATLPLATLPVKKQFSAMSLIYSECSLTAFASWAAHSPSIAGDSVSAAHGAQRRPPVAIMASPAPTSSALFHCCQVCGQWGHYELECESLDEHAIISEIANEVTALRSIRNRPRLEQEQDDLTTRNGQGGSRFKSSVTAAATSCMVCKLKLRKEWRQSYLACGECRAQCHIRCASPALEAAPLVGGWLCTPCSTNQGNVPLDKVVEIEGCEGFVIEQRKLPMARVSDSSIALAPTLLSESMGIDFGERSWSRALCVTDTKALADVSAKRRAEVAAARVTPSEPPVVAVAAAAVPTASDKKSADKQHEFSEGEFCWAKREHSEKGKIGRDEWWPAQVLASIKDPRSMKYFAMEVTPYLVKFFGISRASRVRASSAIPFFQNFRAIGYERLTRKAQETTVDHRFRKGVEEAISLMGFKSMGQILARADEIVQAQKPKALLPRVPPQRRFMARKLENDGFVTFKQNGFLIYARESAERKKKPVNIGPTDVATEKERLVEPITEVKGPIQVYSHTRLIGCLVAWRSAPDESSRWLNMKVGTVLAADVEKKLALVSAIADWESKLTPPSSKIGVVVTDYKACSTEWMSMEKLHMLCNGPDDVGEQVVSKEVVSGLLSRARDAILDEQQKAAAELPISSEEEEPTRPIEAILKERKSYSGREYLVKWKNIPGQALFPSLGTAWVPERSVGNPNMVLQYQIENVLSALSLSAQTKVESTTSYDVIAALKNGVTVLEASLEVPVPMTNERLCPFCKLTLEDMHNFADHIKEHHEEPNYSLIREAARLCRTSWYVNTEIDKS